MTLHEDELELDLPLVRALVDRARPDLADQPLRALAASGSSNALFRLGDDLLVRLPRQPGGSTTIAKEARWLPYLAPALPVGVPEVLTVGEAGLGYPERWSIVRWIDGDTPAVQAGTGGLAGELAGVVRALRALPVPAPALTDPALRWYRAEPLAQLDVSVRGYLADCQRLPDLDLDLAACLRVWESALRLPDPSENVHWLHGDLVAENLLVTGPRLAAVLDFGGLAVGEPSVDLIVAWEVLDPSGRALFRSLVGVDEAGWQRGRAWALVLALMTFPYYWNTMRERCSARLAMARAVLEDAATGRG